MIRAGMSNIKRQTIRAKPSSRWRSGDATANSDADQQHFVDQNSSSSAVRMSAERARSASAERSRSSSTTTKSCSSSARSVSQDRSSSAGRSASSQSRVRPSEFSSAAEALGIAATTTGPSSATVSGVAAFVSDTQHQTSFMFDHLLMLFFSPLSDVAPVSIHPNWWGHEENRPAAVVRARSRTPPRLSYSLQPAPVDPSKDGTIPMMT
jgi:hypothetical protein